MPSPPAAKPILPPDWVFYVSLALLGGAYLVLIVAMLVADLFFTTPGDLLEALGSPEIKYAIKLSLVSCTITAILSLWVAVPLGYLLARTQFWGKFLLDTLLDIPIVLPPLVIGLSLLILFQSPIGKFFERTDLPSLNDAEPVLKLGPLVKQDVRLPDSVAREFVEELM